tara:strand:+ start:398 stop:703 length:306 start_codon:yes stop_codon:yes gene_type:complete
MKRKKKYFPNKINALQKAHHKYFESLPYDAFMDWKMSGWEIPEDVSCIIREKNVLTGKVKEYIYKTDLGAKRKIRKLMDARESEISICSEDRIHLIKPEDC